MENLQKQIDRLEQQVAELRREIRPVAPQRRVDIHTLARQIHGEIVSKHRRKA